MLVAADVGTAPCGWRQSTNSSAPRPSTLCCFRSAIMRFIQFSSENGIALLGLDVDRLVAVHRVHDRRREQPRGVRAREPAVPVAAPLHRRAHAVAVAEVDVVAHPDLVAVVDDGRAGQREEQHVQQLDAAAAVLHQRGEPAADADVQPHHGIGGVGVVHVVAFFVGHHLERQLVVVAEEERPLARRRDARASAAGCRRSDGDPPAARP